MTLSFFRFCRAKVIFKPVLRILNNTVPRMSASHYIHKGCFFFLQKTDMADEKTALLPKDTVL